jgi:hypothetical protein
MPVEVKGFDSTLKALRQVTPDLYKEMNKEIASALRVVRDDARSMVQPAVYGLSNFQYKGIASKSRTGRARSFPKYDPVMIRKGLVYRLGRTKVNRSGYQSFYGLFNTSAAGAIIETAGRKNPAGDPKSQSNNPRAGAYFNRAIHAEYGKFTKVGSSNNRASYGRLLFTAYERDQGKTKDAVFTAIDKALKKFELRASVWGIK